MFFYSTGAKSFLYFTVANLSGVNPVSNNNRLTIEKVYVTNDDENYVIKRKLWQLH